MAILPCLTGVARAVAAKVNPPEVEISANQAHQEEELVARPAVTLTMKFHSRGKTCRFRF